jgi:DNA-directed RNA polymerase specialized sigma24 family protein
MSPPAVSRDDDARETRLPHALESRERNPVGRNDRRSTIDRSDRIARSTAAEVRPTRADNGAEEFAATISNLVRQNRLSAMVAGIARVRYGIAADDAQDVYQDSVVAYLLVKDRYARDANHFGLFVGIFHHKAMRFLSTERGRGRSLERFAAHLACGLSEFDAATSPDAAVRRVERDAAIRDSVASLPRDERALLLELGEGRSRRLDLIARLGINRNTFDSRLHEARASLRRSLRARSGF